jgi:hypothetical protein
MGFKTFASAAARMSGSPSRSTAEPGMARRRAIQRRPAAANPFGAVQMGLIYVIGRAERPSGSRCCRKMFRDVPSHGDERRGPSRSSQAGYVRKDPWCGPCDPRRREPELPRAQGLG